MTEPFVSIRDLALSLGVPGVDINSNSSRYRSPFRAAVFVMVKSIVCAQEQVNLE